MFFGLGEIYGRRFMWYVYKGVLGGGADGVFYLGRKHSTISGSYQVDARYPGLEKTNFVTNIT